MKLSYNISITKPTITTSVEHTDDAVPVKFNLEQNYPNPFNPSTTISYTLNKPDAVKLNIYDILGRLVNTLVDEYKAAGSYTILWNGKNNHGQDVKSGVYIYSLTAGDRTQNKKMLLLK